MPTEWVPSLLINEDLSLHISLPKISLASLTTPSSPLRMSTWHTKVQTTSWRTQRASFTETQPSIKQRTMRSKPTWTKWVLSFAGRKNKTWTSDTPVVAVRPRLLFLLSTGCDVTRCPLHANTPLDSIPRPARYRFTKRTGPHIQPTHRLWTNKGNRHMSKMRT